MCKDMGWTGKKYLFEYKTQKFYWTQGDMH